MLYHSKTEIYFLLENICNPNRSKSDPESDNTLYNKFRRLPCTVRCITSKSSLLNHLKLLSFSSSKTKVTCKSDSVFFSFIF